MITLKEYRKFEQQATEFFNRHKADFDKCGFSKEDIYHELVVDLLAGEKNGVLLCKEYVVLCLDRVLFKAKEYNKVFVGGQQ